MAKESYSYAEQWTAARQMEAEGNMDEAEKQYLQMIKTDPTNAEAYNRLLVIYRKQKEYRKELATVNKAIKAYEDNFLKEQKKWISEHKKAAKLSRVLAKGLGLINNKGLPLRQDRQLASWHKRKANLQKKIKK